MKAILKIWQGLRFWRPANRKGWLVLASYHHPDSITWRWSLDYYASTRPWQIFPLYGPSYNNGKSWRSPSGCFSGWLRIPFLGFLSLSTQSHMWRT